MKIEEQLKEASEYLRGKIKTIPETFIVLGSGLAPYASQLSDPISIPYSEIPHFFNPSVKGHSGQLIIGQLEGTTLGIFSGRLHLYEGLSAHEIVFPVRAVSLLGAKNLILTNAAGGINSEYIPGDIVAIRDHINLSGTNPLMGKNIELLGTRFPDMSHVYAPEFLFKLRELSKKHSINLKEGVYVQLSGPSYETPAEIKMLKVMGADMVGMSTACEAIAANHAGLKIAALSCITNYAAGISQQSLNHQEVQDTAKTAMEKFKKILNLLVEDISQC